MKVRSYISLLVTAATVVALLLTAAVASAQVPDPNGTPGAAGEQVNVCHATGSETNPYVFITVNVNSTDFQAHLMHAEQGNPPGGLRDIIGVSGPEDCPAGPPETPGPTETPGAEATSTPGPTETPEEQVEQPTAVPEATEVPEGPEEQVEQATAVPEATQVPEVAGVEATPAPSPEATQVPEVAGVEATPAPSPEATEVPEVAGVQATAVPQATAVQPAAPTATPEVAGVLPSAGEGDSGSGMAILIALAGLAVAGYGYALKRWAL